MPQTTARAKPTPKKTRKSAPRRFTNAELLKLAAKNRPPQRWYDETIDPTKRAPKSAPANHRER